VKQPGQFLQELYALGVSQQRAGLAESAVATYRRCLSLSPASPEIHNNLGTALDQLGRLPEAVRCFEQALALRPTYARPRVNLGKVLRQQGKADRAAAILEQAVVLSPENPLALTNLGLALADLGRSQDALRFLKRAVAIGPGLAEAHTGLARVLLELGDTLAALESVQRATALEPGLVDGWVPLATVLLMLQRFPEAVAAVDRVLTQRPNDAAGLTVALHCSLRMCDWRRLEQVLPRARALDCGTEPFLLLGVSDDPEEQLRMARLRAATAAADRRALPLPVSRRTDRIRVAYVSGDFHLHATSFLLAELLELHDRSAFEVLGVSYGPDDRSLLRGRLLGAFDQWLDARERSDLEVATWLRERDVDIAVDLKGHTAHSRLGIFAHRPATVQVSYLGYPGTMAAPFIDYLIADSFVIPEAQRRFYAERIAYLPGCYQPNDRKRRVSEHVPTRSDAHLPEDGFVFCSFNGNWKIRAPVFGAWMRLLAAIPGSVLWLLEDNPSAVEHLRSEAAARGVEPGRLIFCKRVSNEDHLARHRLADLFLDTFPCNAHTTASDALWTGLPLVTCVGRTFASRVAGSLLQAAGLPDLITTSLEEYERLALNLARAPERLASIRAGLTRDRESLPLFDTPTYCRQLEAAYRQMWQLQRDGKAPETFLVQG